VGLMLAWLWPRPAAEVSPAVSLWPLAGSRLLVIAPHCDDETLGAGGLIQRAVASGGHVRVVLMTNGDGFPLAAETQYHKLWVRQVDYRRLAHARQEETLAALRVLGVPASQVTFLGYPDRGLLPLWQQHWWPAPAYRSRYTGESANPYDNSLSPGAPYRADEVIADLVHLLRSEQPTDIVLPYPNDAHPDHWATSAMVRLALARLEWLHPFAPPVLHYYLVHRGARYPYPLGYRPDLPLLPPPALAGLDTQWTEFPLTKGQRQRKHRALRCYRTQMRVMGWFLNSFVRSNELFASEQGKLIPLAGQAGDIPMLLALDPSRDTLLRNVDPGGDLTSISAYCTEADLHLRITTRRAGKRGLHCRVFVHPVPEGRPFYCDAVPGRAVRWRRVGETTTVAGARGRLAGDALLLSIPRRALGGATGIMVGAESRLFRLLVDRTACVLAELPAPGIATSPAPGGMLPRPPPGPPPVRAGQGVWGPPAVIERPAPTRAPTHEGGRHDRTDR